MAVFGLDFYGLTNYGIAPGEDVFFDVSPFVVTCQDYSTLFLTWNVASGDATQIILVRSQVGFPVHPRDGVVLIESDDVSNSTQFSDTTVDAGVFYYYGIFLFSPSVNDYRLAGLTIGLANKNYGYSQRLLDLLPNVLKVSNAFALQPTDSEINPSLVRFLDIFGFQLDGIRTEYDTLLNTYDLNKVSANLLPAMTAQFGAEFQQSLGQKQARRYMREHVRMMKFKGTYSGTELLAASYSGYGTVIADGKNLFLNYNQSSFEEDLDTWTYSSGFTGTTLALHRGFWYESADFENKRTGSLKVTTGPTGTGSPVIVLTPNTIVDGVRTTVRNGIPIPRGSGTVCFSIYSRAGSVGRSISCNITYYNAAGNVVAVGVTQSNATNATGTWTRAFVYAASSPTDDLWAVPSFTINSAAANEVHYFDAAQIELTSTNSPSAFDEARNLTITLEAERINQCKNPTFALNTNGWRGNAASDAVSVSSARFLYGSTSMAVTNSVASPACRGNNGAVGGELLSTAMRANTSYVVSVWVQADTSATLSMTCTFEIVTAANVPSQTVTLSQSNGQTVIDNQRWYEYSAKFNTNSTAAFGFFRLVSSGGTGRTFYVDGAFVERALVKGTYFDGDSSTVSEPDYRWEDPATKNGRSYYYPDVKGRLSTLNALLPAYLPAGRTYRILIAQPGN